MTIKEKAEKTGLTVEKVAELCSAAGIESKDVDRKLESVEAMTLGKVVKKYMEVTEDTKEAPKSVRFWTHATRHIIQAGKERIVFEGNVLVLNEENDIGTIALVRSLRNIVGRYSVYEVINNPFDEESDKAVWFNNMLEDIVFTGHNRERSKAGMKTVRALFEPEELAEMGANSFDPRRLVMKALRNKSLKLVSNNG